MLLPSSRRAATVYGMRAALRRLLDDNDGVVRRGQLTAELPHHLVDRAVSGGHLVRMLPQVYAQAHLLDHPTTRLRAALRYGGEGAALSHTTGLSLWDLPLPAGGPVHLTADGRRLRATSAVVVHRRHGFRHAPPLVVTRNGLSVVRLENCLVDSWPLMSGYERRAPLIVAVQRRLTTAARVFDIAAATSSLSGRASLLCLLDLLGSGCHSELEIWGFRHVFSGRSLPLAQRQLPVTVGTRRAYLDVAYVDEMVDVELDGSRYHFREDQRERDMRRDAALVTLGWLVLRFSHRRLHEEPDGVRREVRATLEVRRRQLTLGPPNPPPFRED